MKLSLLFLLSFFFGYLHAQNDSSQDEKVTTTFYLPELQWAFGAGIGIQTPFSGSKAVNDSYYNSTINTGAAGWVNAVRANGNIQHTIQLKVSYREGSFKTSTGSHFPTIATGSFRLIRSEIGTLITKSYGERKNFFFGAGVHLGIMPYVRGNAVTTSSAPVNYNMALMTTVTTYNNPGPLMTKAYVGFDVDLHQQIRFNSGNCLLLGINAKIESPEIPGSRSDKMADVYFAYKFYRKPKK
ncbi:MAG: hypothetical protein ACJ76F_12555 [Bacteroidia bacterium]